jgi:hypothetical protein
MKESPLRSSSASAAVASLGSGRMILWPAARTHMLLSSGEDRGVLFSHAEGHPVCLTPRLLFGLNVGAGASLLESPDGELGGLLASRLTKWLRLGGAACWTVAILGPQLTGRQLSDLLSVPGGTASSISPVRTDCLTSGRAGPA